MLDRVDIWMNATKMSFVASWEGGSRSPRLCLAGRCERKEHCERLSRGHCAEATA